MDIDVEPQRFLTAEGDSVRNLEVSIVLDSDNLILVGSIADGELLRGRNFYFGAHRAGDGFEVCESLDACVNVLNTKIVASLEADLDVESV